MWLIVKIGDMRERERERNISWKKRKEKKGKTFILYIQFDNL